MTSVEQPRPITRPDHSQVIPGSTLEVNFDIPDWMKGEPLDVNQPFDWAAEAENEAGTDDTQEDDQASDEQTVEASAAEQNENVKPQGRFSKAFARAKNAMSVDESRWTAEPAEPHAQAFDAHDTWKDPFEKFYGPAGPVKEYTAVPPLKQKAEKAETDADDENSTDDTTEKQTRITIATEKVLGAWAVQVNKQVDRFYDSVDLQSALIDSLNTFDPTDEDKAEIAKDVQEAEAEQKRLDAQEKADRRAARKQTVKTQVVAAKETVKKLPTKEAKKLAVRGVVGAAAVTGAVASNAYDRYKQSRAKRTQPAQPAPSPRKPDTSVSDAYAELQKIAPDA